VTQAHPFSLRAECPCFWMAAEPLLGTMIIITRVVIFIGAVTSFTA
jgi:hypothetical protein